MSEKRNLEVEVTEHAQTSRTAIIVLLVISILVSLVQAGFLYYLTGGKTVQENILAHEYSKVGGAENYKVVTDLQKEILVNPHSGQDIATQKNFLEQLKQARGNNVPVVTEHDTDTTDTNAQTLSDEQKKSVLENAVVEGNKDADVVIVEYSEMECPYCAQLYHDTKLHQTASAEYGDKVAFIYKNNRGVDHNGTEVKALGLLCANKVAGPEAYTKFYTHIMDNTTLRPQERSGTVFDVKNLAEAAKVAGVTDIAAWQSCVDNKETLEQFAKETQEAGSFGLRGTPGVMMFNQKTGKYTTVSGAYPYSEFKSKIDSLLAE